MGQEVSKLWNLEEQKQFDCIVKMNPISEGKNFLKSALECFRTQGRETIVNYYFNVYVPRRLSIKTRAGIKIVDTDEEEDGKDSKSSRKRYRADSGKFRTRYLTGRR